MNESVSINVIAKLIADIQHFLRNILATVIKLAAHKRRLIERDPVVLCDLLDLRFRQRQSLVVSFYLLFRSHN